MVPGSCSTRWDPEAEVMASTNKSTNNRGVHDGSDDMYMYYMYDYIYTYKYTYILIYIYTLKG